MEKRLRRAAPIAFRIYTRRYFFLISFCTSPCSPAARFRAEIADSSDGTPR